MPDFEFSLNNINQTAVNTALGADATSAQAASIDDRDTFFDSGGSWDWSSGPPDINVQVDTNVINQTAVNTAFDGNASSAQLAALDDRDTVVDQGSYDSSDLNFHVSTNMIDQTAVNTAIDLDHLFALG
jgi:hypothetical protein